MEANEEGDSRTWKSILCGWTHPTQVLVEGEAPVIKYEMDWTPAEYELTLGNDMALNAIFNGVTPNVFKMISKCTVAKEAW
ncbi:hypothetical protein LIER_22856 [Lithospermum erythrorhizon]|uniref:Gag-pol polyprotein n=1 Tax=Lithospermum erythrorhizon TaxID=34254 RepID=A0AAV3QYZ1_LITER